MEKEKFTPLIIDDIICHMSVKHILILLLLCISISPIDHAISSISTDICISEEYEKSLIEDDNESPVKSDIDMFILLITASGLILAGAISGYFSFSYLHTVKRENKYSLLHMLLGHFSTGLTLLVIGILLLVTVSSLNTYSFSSVLSPGSFILATLLYFSMVFYDLYDFMNLLEEHPT